MGLKRRTKVPARGASESELLAFRDEYFDEHSVSRSREMERLARNLFYYLGRQWIEVDRDVLVNGVRGYAFRDLLDNRDGIDMPRPVTNIIPDGVGAEVTSHWKRELVPKILPTARDPTISEAAKFGENLLRDRIRKLDWKRKRYQADLDTALFGLGVVKSFWDESWVDLTEVGVPTAVGCSVCGAILARPEIPAQLAEGLHQSLLGMVEPVEDEDEPLIRLRQCPTCGVASQLSPYEVSKPEAKERLDLYGRPLGMSVAKGNTGIENVSPFDYFPENGGITFGPQDCRQFGQRTVRSIEWVVERIPELADTIEPDDPHELASGHPTLGDFSVWGYYDRSMDTATYNNHVWVYEFYSLPTIWDPEGRMVWWVNGKPAIDEALMVTITDEESGQQIRCPRVDYAFSSFRPRPGHFFPSCAVDDAISPQNRLNCIDYQIISARERLGDPRIAYREGTIVEGAQTIEGMGSAAFLPVKKDSFDTSPGLGLEIFGDKLFNTDVYQERDRCIQDLQRIFLPQEIESGRPMPNTPATSSLLVYGEQAERRRAMRDLEATLRDEKVWRHQLLLLWTMRVEEDDLDIEDKDGTWRREQFDRKRIKGQVQVKMEPQAHVNRTLYVKEGMREAQADNLVFADGPASRKKLLEYRDLPTDVNEGECREVDLANRQWVDWITEGRQMVIDETMDDPKTRHVVLANLSKEEEGIRRAREAGWPEALQYLAGWEDRLAQMETAESQVLAAYGGRVPEASRDKAYADLVTQYTAATLTWQAQKTQFESNQQPGMLAPFPVPPPQKPPEPNFLPAARNVRIFGVWMSMLKEAQQEEIIRRCEEYMKMRSVIDAYRIMARQAAAAANQPPPPTPGAGAATGTSLEPGTPVEGPGALVS